MKGIDFLVNKDLDRAFHSWITTKMKKHTNAYPINILELSVMHFVADKKNSVIEVISKIQIALTNKHFQRDFFNNVKTFKFIIVLNFDVMYSVIVWLFHILVQIRTCMSEFSRTFSSWQHWFVSFVNLLWLLSVRYTNLYFFWNYVYPDGCSECISLPPWVTQRVQSDKREFDDGILNAVISLHFRRLVENVSTKSNTTWITITSANGPCKVENMLEEIIVL